MVGEPGVTYPRAMEARRSWASGFRVAAGPLVCAAAAMIVAVASAAPVTSAAAGSWGPSALPRPALRTEPSPPIVFVIPLAALEDLWALDERRDVAQLLDAAGRHSSAAIFITAYVTAGDASAGRSAAADVADRLVVEFGGYLASRGVEPE